MHYEWCALILHSVIVSITHPLFEAFLRFMARGCRPTLLDLKLAIFVVKDWSVEKEPEETPQLWHGGLIQLYVAKFGELMLRLACQPAESI